MTIAAIALLVCGLLALAGWAYFRRRTPANPLPVGKVRSADTETLVSARYGITGRPDFLVDTDGGLVPVEVKSRYCDRRGPYPGEEAQLVAYCVLAEDVLKVKVPYGLLRYQNREWRVEYNASQRDRLLRVVAEMRAAKGAIDRNHRQAARCRGCGLRGPCGQAL